MATDNDFYESDEPVEKVMMAFERGEKGLTDRPTWSGNSYFRLPGPIDQFLQKVTNKSTVELPAH
jgi:hypothetical protein